MFDTWIQFGILSTIILGFLLRTESRITKLETWMQEAAQDKLELARRITRLESNRR